MNGKLLSLIVSGLPLLAFGIVWVFFVNPRIERIPETYSSEIVFQGQYQMLTHSEVDQITTLRIDASINTKTFSNDSIYLVENIYSPTTELTTPSLKLPAYSTEFAVNRRTRDYVGMGGRAIEGKFSFPVNIEENSRYLIRNNLSQTVMQYEFIKTKEIYGIDTYEFHGHISDMPKKNYPFTPPSALVKTLWPTMKDYRSQPNAVLDYSVEIYVEPKSGIVVDRTDIATLTSVAEGPKSKTPIFISEIKFTEQTTLDNINKAKKRKLQLAIYGFYGPYGMIILGTLLIMISIGFYLKILSMRYKSRKVNAKKT